MSAYLTCEADLNFPVPNASRVVAHLRTLFNGTMAVMSKDIAIAFGCDVSIIEDVLRRASHSGMTRQIGDDGWVPATTQPRNVVMASTRKDA